LRKRRLEKEVLFERAAEGVRKRRHIESYGGGMLYKAVTL
jgi:hypothetical protein